MKKLPIVVVTTRGDDASRTKSLEKGASRFLHKPFTPEGILGVVEELVGGPS